MRRAIVAGCLRWAALSCTQRLSGASFTSMGLPYSSLACQEATSEPGETHGRTRENNSPRLSRMDTRWRRRAHLRCQAQPSRHEMHGVLISNVRQPSIEASDASAGRAGGWPMSCLGFVRWAPAPPFKALSALGPLHSSHTGSCERLCTQARRTFSSASC